MLLQTLSIRIVSISEQFMSGAALRIVMTFEKAQWKDTIGILSEVPEINNVTQ
jgi:hypothetical protein